MKDRLYMQRAMELAVLGAGHVSPNPMVGCVIVHDDEIIGEGYHKKYGGPHAEIEALHSVKDKSKLKDATLYVNLEPCAHYGKTPPCAEKLMETPIKRIVISNIDPNPLVAGKGIEMLMGAGKEVEIGLMEEEGAHLNKRFFCFIKNKRPYIILKWAETSDGFIARENNDSKWISNALSRKLVHRWRSEEDAIIVGTNTVLFDNPQLNVRDWEGRNPTRLIIDKELQIPQGAHVLDGSQTTIVYNYHRHEVKNLVEYVKLDPAEDLWKPILEDLTERKITSCIVEGGAKLLQYVIDHDLWDEARVFKSPIVYGTGIAAPVLRGRLIHSDKIMDDHLFYYENSPHFE